MLCSVALCIISDLMGITDGYLKLTGVNIGKCKANSQVWPYPCDYDDYSLMFSTTVTD